MALPDFITHYHYPDKKPFLNLSDLPEEERAHIIAELNSREAAGHTLRAFPDWYMPQRLDAEQRLRTLHTERFGTPARSAPHYFTLGRSPVLEWIYKEQYKTVQIPVNTFSEHELSFCINDSLWTMAASRKPGTSWNNRWFEGRLYTYHEVCDVLRELGVDVENRESLHSHKLSFIEGLVWTDKPLYLAGESLNT